MEERWSSCVYHRSCNVVWLEGSVNYIKITALAMLFWLEGSVNCIQITAHAMLSWLEGSVCCVNHYSCNVFVFLFPAFLHRRG